MTRGRIYIRCNQCDKLLNKEGYRDGSIALTNAEAFPYCSDCIKKNGWKKCSSCDRQGSFGDDALCPWCKLEQEKKKIKEESQKNYENAKKYAEEKLNNLQQQRINQAFTCRGSCGKVIGLNEKAYTWEGETGYYCQNCIVSKINQEYDEKHGQQPINQPICSLCKIKPADYRWPDNGKLICESCKPRFVLGLVTAEKILKGQGVDIDSLYLPEVDKISLRAGQKIMQGEAVNVNNLAIDDEDKEALRELQKQKSPQKDNSANYVYECQDCGRKKESFINPFSCYDCQSRNIKVWKDGKLQHDGHKKTNDSNKKTLGLDHDTLAFVIMANLIFWPLIIWLIVRWWRKRKHKKITKLH